jgi:hypothetical protein
VYRLGQTRNVQVIRFVIKDSIEERVIESQEKKRELAASAFGNKKDRKKVKEARLADLKDLYNHAKKQAGERKGKGPEDMWANVPNHSKPGNAVASSSKDQFHMNAGPIASSSKDHFPMPIAARKAPKRPWISDDEEEGEELAGLGNSARESILDGARPKRVRKAVRYDMEDEDSEGDVSVVTDGRPEDQGDEFKDGGEDQSDGNITDGRSERSEEEYA